jgi:hypothetical protein
MKVKDKEIFEILKFNEIGKYWYYLVPTSVRRSGIYKISINKYNKLKSQYLKINK